MSDNALCPYCDKPRGNNNHGIMKTCGADACFRAACREAAALQRPLPWSALQDIDFGNGFDAHNLQFRPAWGRRIVL